MFGVPPVSEEVPSHPSCSTGLQEDTSAEECTCDAVEQARLRALVSRNARENATLLHQAYSLSPLYMPTLTYCKKHPDVAGASLHYRHIPCDYSFHPAPAVLTSLR
jgi:hypothetical protein